MNDKELQQCLEGMKALLISVSTGGPRINDVEDRYNQLFSQVASACWGRGIENPVPYQSLWDWYSHWSSGDYPTYQSRRDHISRLFRPILQSFAAGQFAPTEPTGWQRVDRCVGELRSRLVSASNEEQFQAIGLLAREALISAAQMVYDPSRHVTTDNVMPSQTDAKRMLEAFIAAELAGGAYEEARRHAKSTLDFAVALQHRRTATFRDAALCVEATSSAINIIAILAGRRDRA